MHPAAIHLIPILAAEKNRTVFYILAGLLALWAVLISLGVGLRRPDFPSNVGGQRTVILISAVLVIATASSGVITSGGPSKANAASAAPAVVPQQTASTPEPTASSTPATVPKTASSHRASPSAGEPSKLSLAANPEGQLAYDTKTLSAKSGRITLTMANMSPVPHNVTIAQGSNVLGATPTFQGGSKTLTLNLKPGSYTFYCSVPGHRQAGMEGTLTVS
jgi:plastocyanin